MVGTTCGSSEAVQQRSHTKSKSIALPISHGMGSPAEYFKSAKFLKDFRPG
ncbi:MAG: hypothetical protein JWQ04_36 [Pedosphaera sp.]|nr:hypothetical protein [Pedosphaera sp.]